jgi:hypothetical protein
MNDPRTGVVLTTAPADVQERQPLPDVDEPRCHRFEIAWGHVRPQSSQTGSSSLHRGSPTPPCMLLAVQTAGRWLWRPGSLVGSRLTSESSADAAGPSLHFSSFNWFCAEYLPPFFLRRLPPRLPFADLAGPGGLHPVSTAVHHPLPFWPNPPIRFPPTPNQVRRTLTRTSGAQRPITSDSPMPRHNSVRLQVPASVWPYPSTRRRTPSPGRGWSQFSFSGRQGMLIAAYRKRPEIALETSLAPGAGFSSIAGGRAPAESYLPPFFAACPPAPVC